MQWLVARARVCRADVVMMSCLISSKRKLSLLVYMTASTVTSWAPSIHAVFTADVAAIQHQQLGTTITSVIVLMCWC